jgi:hypothetical protein
MLAGNGMLVTPTPSPPGGGSLKTKALATARRQIFESIGLGVAVFEKKRLILKNSKYLLVN